MFNVCSAYFGLKPYKPWQLLQNPKALQSLKGASAVALSRMSGGA